MNVDDPESKHEPRLADDDIEEMAMYALEQAMLEHSSTGALDAEEDEGENDGHIHP